MPYKLPLQRRWFRHFQSDAESKSQPRGLRHRRSVHKKRLTWKPVELWEVQELGWNGLPRRDAWRQLLRKWRSCGWVRVESGSTRRHPWGWRSSRWYCSFARKSCTVHRCDPLSTAPALITTKTAQSKEYVIWNFHMTFKDVCVGAKA